MVSKRCLDCGKEARPKLVHPSSLRTEVTLWLIAISVGAGAGLWSLVTSAPDEENRSAVQRIAMTVVQSGEAPATVPQSGYASTSQSLTVRALDWARDAVLRFLASAWWVFPLPLLFSFWRQYATREACIGCRSRHLEVLEPAPDPFAL